MLENLKLLRREMGLSQQQLAERVGVSQQSINKYENHNIEPDISTLIKIADCFSTSVDYLVGHTDIRHVIEPVQQYDLNRDEAVLMAGYRRLSRKQQEALRAMLQAFLP